MTTAAGCAGMRLSHNGNGRVVLQPRARQGMQSGINQMVEAIRPTLGPLPRFVAISTGRNGRAPELLDNGAIIARRILELPDRDADMGAMFLRHVLWQVHERVGDGTATTAVLVGAIYNQGVHYLASGGNAMMLRRCLEEGMVVILNSLSAMTVPVEGRQILTAVAESLCHDRLMARLLGEILDIIGEYGQLDIRAGHGRELDREYVEGLYWEGGLLSRPMIAGCAGLKTELHDASVLISDLDLEHPRPLAQLLEVVARVGCRSFLIIATSLSSSSAALLQSANRQPNRFQVIAARTPGLTSTDQAMAMEDLALLTGGRPLVKAAGQRLDGVQAEDLGGARRAWADLTHAGIVGGRGDPRALRAHLVCLRSAFRRTGDRELREKLRARIGKLMGGSATLWVGGSTEKEVEVRRELAERTAGALRGILREGMVPGGGASLLACRPALYERLESSASAEERAAYQILIRAMEAPTRAIANNAGHESSQVVARIGEGGNGHGFDARAGKVVDMAEAGIWDSAAVLKAAVHSAVSAAALALTTDVLIHHKKPARCTEP